MKNNSLAPQPARTGTNLERPAIRQTKNITQIAVWNMPATPERIFPLLCPVLEYDWIPWWRAEIVHSVSGVAEENCIFRTHVGPPAGLTWVCTRYEPNRYIEYTCFAPDKLIVRLKIALTPTATGTRMEWTRSWFSLGPSGDATIAAWSTADYETMMARHAQEMEHYLRTGTLLPEVRH
jgi:hypothetical protein